MDSTTFVESIIIMDFMRSINFKEYLNILCPMESIDIIDFIDSVASIIVMEFYKTNKIIDFINCEYSKFYKSYHLQI